MAQPFDIGDQASSLFRGLSGFWQRFFRDTSDLEAYYQASEQMLGQVYLDLLGAVLGTSLVDVPVFNKEYWKLFSIQENDLKYQQGVTVEDDRYLYDMPDSTVFTELLQNTIFEPEVTLERDLDFDITENDGFLRLVLDPFRHSQDEDNNWIPIPGVAWRWVTVSVGNSFSDLSHAQDWEADLGVRKGDTLRMLAYAGEQQQEGTAGAIAVAGSVVSFTDTVLPAAFVDVHVGDIIHVYQDGAGTHVGYYVIKSIDAGDASIVYLENTVNVPTVANAGPLSWVHYKGLYFAYGDEDHEVDYIRGAQLVGNVDDVFPVDYDYPVVYAVVRDPADPVVIGQGIAPNAVTDLPHRHLKPGTVVVFSSRTGGFAVTEGVDYSVDYLRGVIKPISTGTWDPGSSVNTVNYEYMAEVLLGSSGTVKEETEGRVQQLAFWAPEVEEDRFTLYYNFGQLVNRFEASSETYKAFLRGIFYLYVSGPILYRVNSALNVAAGYPVISSDGEVLTAYSDGIIGSGADGSVSSTSDTFSSPTHTFEPLDVGGFIIIEGASNDANNGVFEIEALIDDNTVQLETSFGLITEGPTLDWVLTRTYAKTVVTTTTQGIERTYRYPYHVPMKEEVALLENIDVLTYQAFDYLTEAFNVVDYVEDPNWWVNRYIPEVLWKNQTAFRRIAVDELYPNIIGAEDDPRIGDPGFFIGADENGIVHTPTNGVGSEPVPIHRHKAAFIIFDRYMKFHMFLVDIAEGLQLPVQFVQDLEELILITKPSYTYPYVDPGESFSDYAELFDSIESIALGLSLPQEGSPDEDNVRIADNRLVIGGGSNIGDYFRYVTTEAHDTGETPAGAIGGVIQLVPPTSGEIISLSVTGTIAGLSVVEGIDYSFEYDPASPDAWKIIMASPGSWDNPTSNVLVNFIEVVRVNIDAGAPDTTVGFTPVHVGGSDPWYVREDRSQVNEVSEHIDRAIQLTIDAPGSYTY